MRSARGSGLEAVTGIGLREQLAWVRGNRHRDHRPAAAAGLQFHQSITLVFLGRRSIPGIEPGAKTRVEGMVGETEGYLAMTNPYIRLLPREGEGDEDEA